MRRAFFRQRQRTCICSHNVAYGINKTGVEMSVAHHVPRIDGHIVFVELMSVRKRYLKSVGKDLRKLAEIKLADKRIDFAVAIALDYQKPIFERIERLSNLHWSVVLGKRITRTVIVNIAQKHEQFALLANEYILDLLSVIT